MCAFIRIVTRVSMYTVHAVSPPDTAMQQEDMVDQYQGEITAAGSHIYVSMPNHTSAAGTAAHAERRASQAATMATVDGSESAPVFISVPPPRPPGAAAPTTAPAVKKDHGAKPQPHHISSALGGVLPAGTSPKKYGKREKSYFS